MAAQAKTERERLSDRYDERIRSSWNCFDMRCTNFIRKGIIEDTNSQPV